MSEYEEIRARPTHGLNETFLVRDTLRIVCECGERSCIEQLEIEPAAYETLRADPTLFAVKPGQSTQYERTVRCLSVARLAAAVLLLASSGGAGATPSATGVSIDASALSWTVVENTVVISGKVTPHPGIELTLEQRHGSGWLSVGDKPVARTAPSRSWPHRRRPDSPRTAW